MNYVVTMVFSNWTLSKIFEFFKDYLEAEPTDLGLTKIERFKDKRTGEIRDSNRTIILMKRTLFEKAIAAGLDMPQPGLDFRLAEYILSQKSFPAEGYTSNLYLIIPKNVPYTDAEQAILEKIRILIHFGVLQEEDFTLRIPLSSRLTGEHRGFAYLSFNEKVDLTTKAFIKALLNDGFMYVRSLDKLYHLTVFWAKGFSDNVKVQPIKILKKII